MKWLAVLAVVFASGLQAASVTVEAEILSRVVDTLAVATKYARDAQRQGGDAYQPLVSDLREITAGLQRHLHQPALQQRQIEPLRLSYPLRMGEIEANHISGVIASLETAKRLVIDAKNASSQDSGEQVMFAYDALLFDLMEVQHGLESVQAQQNRDYRDLSEVVTEEQK